MRGVAAVVIVLLCSAAPAPAQTVSLEFQNGRVRLVAENASVGQILTEWSRLGGTKIVNGERIPGVPLTLQLEDVSERQALDVVLRGAAGYMVAGREVAAARASVFDRIFILPTSTRAPSTASVPPPAQAPLQAPPVVFSDAVDDDDDIQPPRAPGQPGAVIRLPQGRVLPGIEGQDPLNQVPVEEQNTPKAPARANPFGVTTGSARPGTISPVPRPRNPLELPQER
jgi:hypothetical protein